MIRSGLAWWCRKQTTENLRDELDRAIRLELEQREQIRADPDHEATYRLTVERCIERQHAIQTELERRVV